MRGQRSLNTRVRLWHRLLSQVNRVASLDTEHGCGCALHVKPREQRVMQDVLRVPGAGAVRGMESSSSQLNTVSTAGPLPKGCPSSMVKPAPVAAPFGMPLPPHRPSRAREQQRQQGNSMKAQQNNSNFNPGTSTTAHRLELLPNLLRVHSLPSGSSSLLPVNFTISFSWITLLSPSSPGKFPKIKQYHSL